MARKDDCKCGGMKDHRAKQCLNCRNLSIKGSGNPNYKHGHALKDKGQTKTYMIWCKMIHRCSNPNNKQFNDYGGRGIKVCKRWEVYKNFFNDMGEKPAQMSLDRTNNNKGYSKSNCKWATSQEQNLNRRDFKNKTSKYRGVCWHRRDLKWCASIKYNKKTYYGGSFDCEKDAHKAYLKLKEKIHD